MENFKLQSWKIKLEKWHEPSNKSEFIGFYMEKNSKFTGSFSWSFLCDIHFRAFCDVAFDPHIYSIVRFVLDRAAKLILFVSVAEINDSQASTLRSSAFSPLLPPHLIYWGTVFPILVKQILAGFHASAFLPYSPSL